MSSSLPVMMGYSLLPCISKIIVDEAAPEPAFEKDPMNEIPQ
jgi:hypothetical protein